GVHRKETGGGVAVNVGEGETGVGQGPLGGLGVNLELRQVGQRRVVRCGHARDHGPAPVVHPSAPSLGAPRVKRNGSRSARNGAPVWVIPSISTKWPRARRWGS